MPVRFNIADSEVPVYLIPAPFVNINKSFDKQGDGEILGTRYTIQLDGYLVADMGSPKTNGSFITDGVDVIDTDVTATGGGGKTGFYESLQNKQKALSNLISKIESGSYLEVQSLDASKAGFSAYVRLESVDLPCHDPGDPYKSKYTINLSCDYILGANDSELINDKDDWIRQKKWLISAANENWSIEELDQSVLDRDNVKTIVDDSGVDDGTLIRSNKIYSLTRTISATGKNNFKRSTAYADGFETGDGFTQTYEKNGRAWQQARGYIYDIVDYGNEFLFGADNTAYSYNPAVDEPPTGNPDPALTNDPDDYHLFAMNLPNDVLATDYYKSFNYKRTQNVDVKGGSFSITETWTLAPSVAIATETLEISIQDNADDQEKQITISGTIEGVIDNADNVGIGNTNNLDKNPEREEPVNEYFSHAATPNTPKNKYQNAVTHFNAIAPYFYETAESILKKASGTRGIVVSQKPTSKNITHQPAKGIITYSFTFGGSGSDSNTSNIPFIPYAISEDISINDTYPGQVYAEQAVLGRRLGPVLQNVGTQTHWLREVTIQCKVNISDKFICVDEEDDIVGADSYADCKQSYCDVGSGNVSDCDTKATCEDADSTCHNDSGVAGTWTDRQDDHDWILNPNWANIGTSNDDSSKAVAAGRSSNLNRGNLFTTNMITSKPGYTWPGAIAGVARPSSIGNQPDSSGLEADFHTIAKTTARDGNDNPTFIKANYWTKHNQFIAIKKLLNSLDPMTYLNQDYGVSLSNGNTGNVSKRFTNPPSEAWNPKTGDWSYSIAWVYELDDTYTTFSSTFFGGGFNDDLHLPIGATSGSSNELNRTAPGQYF